MYCNYYKVRISVLKLELFTLYINEALRYKSKLAGSIPDGVIGMFHCLNPSGRTMAMESTQPLTEVSKEYLLGV